MDHMDLHAIIDPWARPVTSLVTILLIRRLQFTIAQLLIIFTPRTSLLRAASIPVQIALAVVAFPHVQHVIVPPISIHYRCLAGGTIALQTILSISVSAMIRLDDTDVSKLTKTQHSTTTPGLRTKMAALTALMNNQRCLGTHLQNNWIAPFDESNPNRVPSRLEAVARTALEFTTGYLFRQVAITELWDRLPLGLFWLLYIASWLNGIYLFGDLVGLLCGDRVEDHPPSFGSIRHTKTIRGFWGKYWHQANRFAFQGASNYVCKEVLGLTGLVQRYLNILFVFSLSGVFHVVTDAAEGIPPRESRAMSFFCAQAVGILLEDGAQALWRRWAGYRRGDAFAVPVWATLLGYLWTWGFLSVTAAWFAQPHEPIFLAKHGVPYGVIRRIGGATGL